MIYDELKATYDRISGSWPEDARAFSGMLLAVINQLEHRIQKLEDQIAKNSRNSSKPPSLDLNRPVKRKSSVNMPKRYPVGQRDNKGQGGKLKDNPDNIVSFKLADCPECWHDLREVAVDEKLRRQVKDIPPIKTVLTEYQPEVKTCPVCITRWQADGCTQQHEFEYGKWGRERVKALLEVFGVQLSTDTLNNFSRAASKQLDGFIVGLRSNLKLMRLYHREEDILRFMVEPLAEFTNNQAERDFRVNKVRVKVSRGFRNMEPAQEFMRIRSLISTAIKQAVCPLQALEMVFTKGNTDYLALINPD
jgi:hypothetical protein